MYRYSGFIYVALKAGEASKHVITHMLPTITVLGVPKQIKTDNGSGYKSSSLHQFCEKLGILHKTGIPYSPQGQGMVGRAHQTIKHQFEKIEKGDWYPTKGFPQNYPSSHTLYFKFFNFGFQRKISCR